MLSCDDCMLQCDRLQAMLDFTDLVYARCPGLAVTFVSDETDAKVLNDVQDRFEVNITELPDEIELSSYSECTRGFGVVFSCWPVLFKTRIECCSGIT